MKSLILGLALIGSIAGAQEAATSRPTPATAVLVGVCEKRQQVLMVVVFTFANGKTLVVDGQNMQGFTSAAEIVQYASTAGTFIERVQKCGDTTA